MADDKNAGYKSVDVGYDTLDRGNRNDTAASMSAFEIFKTEVVLLKWRVLIFACILTFGSYYIYDFPGSIGTGRTGTIQAHFQNKGKAFNQEMNQALYSVYSWPNTVLAVFGGLLIDKFLGLRKAMTLFATLVAIGSVIFAIGVATTQYPLLIMGRVVFGLGGESLAVSQSAFVARWFKDGRGMALAFGIAISFSRVGSSFNFLFSPVIAAKVSVEFATWVGVMACGVSVLACIVLVMLDMYGTRQGVVPQESKETGEPFKLRQIVDMPALFWLASLMCVSVYCAVFPWIGIAKNFFQVKYDLPQDTASQYVSIYQFVCAGGSPVMGGMVDVVGRFSIWMIVAGSGFTLTHLLFLVTAPPPPFMMAFMGCVYSVLVSSLWPAVPYVVAPELVGLAYGIMTAMQNSGLATWPLITGAILDVYTPALDTPYICKEYDGICGTFGDTCPNITEYFHNHTNSSHFVNVSRSTGLSDCCNKSHCDPNLPTNEGYECTEIFFMSTAAAGVLVSILLFIVDKRKLGVLGASPSVREAIKAEMVHLQDEDEIAVNRD